MSIIKILKWWFLNVLGGFFCKNSLTLGLSPAHPCSVSSLPTTAPLLSIFPPRLALACQRHASPKEAVSQHCPCHRHPALRYSLSRDGDLTVALASLYMKWNSSAPYIYYLHVLNIWGRAWRLAPYVLLPFPGYTWKTIITAESSSFPPSDKSVHANWYLRYIP